MRSTIDFPKFLARGMGHMVVSLACVLAAAAAPAAAEGLARIEFHPVATVTMDDSAFLANAAGGDAAAGAQGRAEAVAGKLSIPTRGDDRPPAEVLLHGSSGVGGTNSLTDHAAGILNGMGIATFELDSFSARGITQTVTDQSKLGRLQMIYDAYRALDLLAAHPRIDPDRIGVIGFSRGAEASVFSALARFERAYGAESGATFALHVGFSTPCARWYSGRAEVTGSPVLMLHGEADDWTPLQGCRDYAAELADAGAEVTLLSDPGAAHAIDGPTIPSVRI